MGTSCRVSPNIVVGGWQLSWQAFIKSGTQFTPIWLCDNCEPVVPGNIASGSVDATGGFYGTSFRPLVTGNANVVSGDRIWNPSAFGLPPLGADLFDNPQVAKRNMLFGPGTYGLNMGLRKVFKFGERTRAEVGADINNILNHPLKSPDNYDIGLLGNFSMQVNPTTLKPEYCKRYAQSRLRAANHQLYAGRRGRPAHHPVTSSGYFLITSRQRKSL